MIKVIFILFMILCSFHTISYGIILWKNHNNKIGAVAVVILAVVGVVVPAGVLISLG